MKRTAAWAILILAFCGIADSAYLAISEATGTPLVCNITGLTGCNVVANSAFSRILGIPLADLGVAFYAFVFALAALELVVFSKLLRHAVQGIALIGVICSSIFVLIQLNIIHAFCIYCAISALISLLIFVAALGLENWTYLLKRGNRTLPVSIGNIPR